MRCVSERGLPALPAHGSRGLSVFSLCAQALKYERMRDPATVGAAVFSPAGIHGKLRSFVSEWRMCGRPCVYAVSVDVRRCYDTMLQVCACV